MKGELDNTLPGRVSGWLRFIDLAEPVVIDLAGNFWPDIKGKKVRLTNREVEPKKGMEDFSLLQTGTVGDTTLNYLGNGQHPYFEWFSEENGRVVIELELEQISINA